MRCGIGYGCLASMNGLATVAILMDADAAQAFNTPARREAAGRYLSRLLKQGRINELLADAITEAKNEARSNGLTDADVDDELDAWRSERGG